LWLHLASVVDAGRPNCTTAPIVLIERANRRAHKVLIAIATAASRPWARPAGLRRRSRRQAAVPRSTIYCAPGAISYNF